MLDLMSKDPMNPFDRPNLPQDPTSAAWRRAVTILMENRKAKISALLAEGHKREDIVIVEHHGFPKLSIQDGHAVAQDASMVRLANETDKKFAKRMKNGLWLKTEIKNVRVKVEVVRVKIEEGIVE
jgi:hypothetical protein